jgi:ribosomal protein L37AE/L43A
MESVDQQWQRLKERYALMTQDELAAIAQQASDLTEVAQEALQAVIAERGLDIRLKMEPPAPLRGDPPEAEEIVTLGWPQSAEIAGRAMEALTAAGISSFLKLGVLEGDLKRAHAAMERAFEDEDEEKNKDYAVLCPKCRSGAVVLEERDSSSTTPYHWHCDACGHQWSDEGIEQEVPVGKEEEGSGEEHS